MLRFGISGVYFCVKIKTTDMTILYIRYINLKKFSTLGRYTVNRIRSNWTFG